MRAWMVAPLLAVAPVVMTIGLMTRAYVRAANGRRLRRAACPFEDDDDAGRPLLQEAADIVRESLTLLRLLLAGLNPIPGAWRRLDSHPGSGPVIVLLPEHHLPVASLACLGRRLAVDLDASVHVEPGSGGSVDARADRLVDRLTYLASASQGRVLMLVGHGAGGLVARRAARTMRGRQVRVVTLATPHQGLEEPAARDALVDRVDVVNLYSLHDALVVPAQRAYLAGAYNVALHDEGHFGLVTRERPYVILREALADLGSHAAAS